MTATLPDFDLDGYLPYRLAVAAEKVSKALAAQYRDRYGISIAEWRVLVNVGYAKDQSIRDIESRVSMDKTKVSRAASRLKAAGYLTKTLDDGDRRLLKLTLTPKGAALLAEIVPLAQAYQEAVRAILGPQYDALQSALECLIEEPQI
jgi:DNA-binding MarR family transcriptional regulator